MWSKIWVGTKQGYFEPDYGKHSIGQLCTDVKAMPITALGQ